MQTLGTARKVMQVPWRDDGEDKRPELPRDLARLS